MSGNRNRINDLIPAALFVLTLVTSLTLTFLIWKTLENNILNRARLNFDKAAQSTTTLIQQRMHAYEEILLGGVGLFNASSTVSREEWRQYVESLELKRILPGIQGVGYAEVVQPEQIQQHINRIRAEGFPGYTLKPPGKRSQYTAIVYLEPFNKRNQRAFGYDMFAEPVRHAAMALARDSGQPALSGKIKLIQETDLDVQAGFLMYVPRYRKGAPTNTVAERRAALLGYVYSPFRINDLIDGTLGKHTELKEIDTEIYDGTAVLDSSTLMYDSDAATGEGHAILFSKTVPITIDQHQWTLSFHTTEAFQASIDHSPSRIAALAGIVISLLLSLTIWHLATHRQRAHQLALEMSEAARERESRLNAVLDVAADGIITTDQHGIIVSANPAVETIFGYNHEEILGRHASSLLSPPHEFIPYDSSDQCYSERREIVGLRKDGQVFPLELAVRLVSAHGNAIYVGITRDITERKRVERLKSEFISTVSHELRTPLTSIIGTLSLVTSGVVGAVPREALSLLDIAKDNSQRLLTLINDILDMDRIQSGRMNIELAPHRLNALLEKALASNRDYASQYLVSYVLTDHVDDSVVIEVDPTRFAQIMSNLMSNAAKFSLEGGQVEISVALLENTVEICVTDHGIGIPPEFADKLFEKFTQADSSDARHRGGTGLGLSITKALVERMNGSIRYTSQVQKGTTFCITFPLSTQHRKLPETYI